MKKVEYSWSFYNFLIQVLWDVSCWTHLRHRHSWLVARLFGTLLQVESLPDKRGEGSDGLGPLRFSVLSEWMCSFGTSLLARQRPLELWTVLSQEQTERQAREVSWHVAGVVHCKCEAYLSFQECISSAFQCRLLALCWSWAHTRFPFMLRAGTCHFH